MIVYGLQFPTFNIINTTNLFAFHLLVAIYSSISFML